MHALSLASRAAQVRACTPSAMRILVCGSRTFTDAQRMEIELRQRVRPGDVIVHGAARGADQLANQAAARLGLKVQAYPAQWAQHGKRAGILRNIEMLDSGIDVVLAFWDGRSVGTRHVIELARKRGMDVNVITY